MAATPTQQIKEIKKAHAEFEAGLRQVREEMRILVERAIKKIDLSRADTILKSIKES